MRKSSLAVLFAFLCMFSSQVQAQMNSSEKAYYDNERSTLLVMKDAMTKAPQTGDPDLDFLNEMIPHHEAGVSLAENILKHGTNSQVKQLAQTIIREELEGLGKMEALRDQLKANPNVNKQAEAAYLQVYSRILNTLITKMDSVKPTGNINRDFLNRMIPHLEAGIQMGKTIVKYTKNPELKTIAQNIITSQQKQVAEINKLLKTVQ